MRSKRMSVFSFGGFPSKTQIGWILCSRKNNDLYIIPIIWPLELPAGSCGWVISFFLVRYKVENRNWYIVIEASQERIRDERDGVSISLMLEGQNFLIRTIRFFIPILDIFLGGLLGLDLGLAIILLKLILDSG